MMQQWQQMPTQQKILAVVLIAIIVLALGFVILQLIPRGGAPEQQGAGTSEIGTPQGIEAPSYSAGTPETGAPTSLPSPTGGMVTSVPTTEMPQVPPEGKLETPPRPGRSDPFADLPSTRQVVPFTPITLPSTPEPVIVAKGAGSIGTESFSVREVETNIPALEARSVSLRSYFEPPQPEVTRRELFGWRLIGTIVTEGSVGAIIQTPDEKTRVVRLGGRVTFGDLDLTVYQVEEQRVILKDEKGDEYVLTRQPAAPRTMIPSSSGPIGGFGPSGY